MSLLEPFAQAAGVSSSGAQAFPTNFKVNPPAPGCRDHYFVGCSRAC